ncbi:MAG: FAD/NAD-binding family oxidoreductase, partial [Smithella sp.]
MTDAEKNEADVWTLIKSVKETYDIATLYLEGDNAKFAKRKAGQFASVSLQRPEGWSTPHPFTISAAPEDKILSITVKKLGSFTAALHELPPGSKFRCLGPLGNFCRDIDSKPAITMIGGGIGITPFLSVLRHFRIISSVNKITLFWINKTRVDVFAQNEIAEFSKLLNLTIIHCFSREAEVQDFFQAQFSNVFYEKGHFSLDILKKHKVEREAAFYLCGPPPMMDSALAELEGLQ